MQSQSGLYSCRSLVYDIANKVPFQVSRRGFNFANILKFQNFYISTCTIRKHK